MPVVGSAFQPNDAGAIISRVYDRMNEFKKVENSVESLMNRGYKAEAMELLNKRGNEYAAAEIADYYTTTMRELTQYENAIKASSASPEQKRQQLDELRKLKTRFATTVEQATDKTIPR
jgi:triphosphoribosyl-dephospho-CoA synthetase